MNRGALIQGLAELAPLARKPYLDQLLLHLKEAEAVSRGFFSEYFQGANGWLLYQERPISATWSSAARGRTDTAATTP